MSISSKPLSAGAVVIWCETPWCETPSGDYEFEHSIVVQPIENSGVHIETWDAVVQMPWYAVDELIKVLRAMKKEHDVEESGE